VKSEGIKMAFFIFYFILDIIFLMP